MSILNFLKSSIKNFYPLFIGVITLIIAFLLMLYCYNVYDYNLFFVSHLVNIFNINALSSIPFLPVMLILLAVSLFIVISITTHYEYKSNNSLFKDLYYPELNKNSKNRILFFVIPFLVVVLYLLIKVFILKVYNESDIIVWIITIAVPALYIFYRELKLPDYNLLKLSKDEIFFIPCLFIFLLSISLPALSVIPFVVHYDEATIGNLARSFMSTDINAFDLNNWYGYPNLSFYPAYLFLKYISNNLWGLRLYSVCSVLIAVIPFYYFVKLLFNKEIAAIASIIMFSGHCFLFFFRNGMYHTDGLIVFCLVSFFFFAGIKVKSRLFLYLSGVICALGFYMYLSSRVMIIIMALYLLLIFFINNTKKDILRSVAYFTTGFLICILPLAFTIVSKPDMVNLRASQINILTSDVAYKHASGRYQMDNDALTLPNTLVNHFWISVKSFFSGKDNDRQYTAPRPFLDYFSAIFFLLGLPYICFVVFKLKKSRFFIVVNDERYLFLFLSFWLILILAWVINVDPPTYQKMPIILPVVSIIITIAIYNIVYYMVKSINQKIIKRLIVSSFISISLLLIIVANFEVFLHSGSFGLERTDFYLIDTVVSKFTSYEASNNKQKDFYLLGFKPNLTYSLDFLKDSRVNYNFISYDYFKQKTQTECLDEDLYFIVNPIYDRNYNFIALLHKRYPEGKTRLVKNLQQNLMFILYYVPKRSNLAQKTKENSYE